MDARCSIFRQSIVFMIVTMDLLECVDIVCTVMPQDGETVRVQEKCTYTDFGPVLEGIPPLSAILREFQGIEMRRSLPRRTPPALIPSASINMNTKGLRTVKILG